MRRPVLLKAEGLMLAAKQALDKGDTAHAIEYLEMALADVREYAEARRSWSDAEGGPAARPLPLGSVGVGRERFGEPQQAHPL